MGVAEVMKRKVISTKTPKEIAIDILNGEEYFTVQGEEVLFDKLKFKFIAFPRNRPMHELLTHNFPLHQLIEYDFRDDMEDDETQWCLVSDNEEPTLSNGSIARQIVKQKHHELNYKDNGGTGGIGWRYATPINITEKGLASDY